MKEINFEKQMEIARKVVFAKKAINSTPVSSPFFKNYHDNMVSYEEEFDKLAENTTAEISRVEGRSTARTINALDIAESLIGIENKLNIPKKYMHGVRVVSVDVHAQHFPSAYSYVPLSTHFDAEYRRGRWFITKIYRATCSKNGGKIMMTDEAKQAVIDRLAQL